MIGDDPIADVEGAQAIGIPALLVRTRSVDGHGTIRRCHFVEEVLGNLYSDDLNDVLKPRLCSRSTCDCWIGYVHVPELGLRQGFEELGLLARMRAR